MEKKNQNPIADFFGKIVTSFKRKGFRAGLYATITSVLVIVAVVVLNLIVSAAHVEKDLTTTGAKSLTKETEELLDSIEDELDFYVLTNGTEGLEYLNSYVQMYMELYERANDKISFETVDLLLNPKFAEAYTDQQVIQYSIIVVNETTGLSKYISTTDMVLTETTMDSDTFEWKNYPVGVDIEGQLNAAIRYVMTGQQTKLYAVTGHGEWTLGEEAQNLLRKVNVQYDTLETMTVTAVPEDCDVLFISVPKNDYTEEELLMLKAYADRGGKFLILANSLAEHNNYEKLIGYCGVLIDNRVIVEGNSSYHNPSSQMILYPKMESGNRIYDSIAKAGYLPMQSCFALSYVQDSAFDFEKTALLTSSADSYGKSVTDGMIKTLVKENGDPEGPFKVAVHVKNTETKSEAVIASSDYVFEDSLLKISNFANAGFLTGSVGFMTEAETMSSIRTIAFEEEEMITVTAAKANAIAIVIVAVIPAMLLLIGICIMVRRKSR